MELYSHSDRRGGFDAVVCVFFLDTLPDTLAALAVLTRQLRRPGGRLLLAGPLHYHHSPGAARRRVSPRYCFSQLLRVLQGLGYQRLHMEILEHVYSGEESVSMKPEFYRIPVAVFQLL